MLSSPDFKEILSLFNKYKVRYLVVGGYAVMKYSEPRYTKDLDLWIAIDPLNAAAVFLALKEFGAPLVNLTANDFTQEGYFYQMGNAPFRLDIMMSIPGVEFEPVWKRRVEVKIDGLSVQFISREDLIKAKIAAGRPQDKLDVEKLKKAEKFESS
ncbi:MAG: hypothetical protein GY941_25270 [Planctomycetes bacterium]|nr:hypothetical protein [Planctomycetota bacterium]